MIADIENKILEWMKQAGLGVRHADIQKGKGIRYPAAFVYTESGNFSKVGQVKFRCELGVFVLVAFRNVDTEKKRRHGLYPILEGVIQGLMFNDLGLEIRPLVPVRFHNITDKEFQENHVLVFQVEFKTSFLFALDDGLAGAPELLRMGLEYYLTDPEEDGAPDAVDQLKIGEVES